MSTHNSQNSAVNSLSLKIYACVSLNNDFILNLPPKCLFMFSKL